MSDLLIVPDDDDTRRGLIHAFAYAEGIGREDVPRVSAEARRRWENRADRALTELRFLSAAYAAGQADRERVAAAAALDDSPDPDPACLIHDTAGADVRGWGMADCTCPVLRIDPRDLLAGALARPIDRAAFLGTTDPQEGAPR